MIIQNHLIPIFIFPTVLAINNSVTPYQACIDDSDCVGLGHKYACFLYMCYPWKEPNDPINHPTCKSVWDCWNGNGQCYKHYRVREIGRGVCFRSIRKCFRHGDCHGEDDESRPLQKCCGSHCCPINYYKAWQELPCTSDLGCQSALLGSSCCQNQKCCDQSSTSTSSTNQTLIAAPTTTTTTTTSKTTTTTTTTSKTTTTTTTTTTSTFPTTTIVLPTEEIDSEKPSLTTLKNSESMTTTSPVICQIPEHLIVSSSASSSSSSNAISFFSIVIAKFKLNNWIFFTILFYLWKQLW